MSLQACYFIKNGYAVLFPEVDPAQVFKMPV